MIRKYIFIVQVTRQLSIDIINRFAEHGEEIILVTGIVESNYAPLHPSVKVVRFNKHTSASLFGRMFSWTLFTILSFFYILIRSRRYELILVTTPPFLVHLGDFFYRLRKQKYHLVIWDLYPDVLVHMRVMGETSLPVSWWKKANTSAYKHCGNIFTLGRHLSEAIKKYTDREPVIIPNWSDTKYIQPIPKSENRFIREHGLQDKFIVMYSGNLGITHNIEVLVETAELLKDHPHIVFIIIGDGAKRPKIERWVMEKKVSNVIMLPYQDKSMLPHSISAADLGVVTLGDGAENVSVPSKTYTLLAAGVPILAFASLQSELEILVSTHRCGVIFEHPAASEVAACILRLCEEPEKLQKFAQNSREASFQYTVENAEKYYQYICGKNQG